MSETRPHTGPMILGAVLGSYRILGEISSGGMGTVFRAEHVLLGRPAAVKLLRPDLTTNVDLVERFVNEAKAVTACKHPGIVEVYDFGYTPDGHSFIVMELLEGEPLARRLSRIRLTEPAVVAIAHGIASALKAAHKVGVIHRDLKPDNVFLVPDPDGGPDRTKVLDFGIAKLAEPSQSGRRHTQTGTLIGTPLYMAPEQARAAGAIDHRADLYSLGCIIYHMLVGRPPFVAEGGGEIIALQMFGEVEPPSRLAAITPEIEQLVLRLLAKEPADRFDSAAEVASALAAMDPRLARASWQGAAGTSGTPGPPGPSGNDVAVPGANRGSQRLGNQARPGLARSKRARIPMVAGALTVVLAAGVGLAVMLRGGSVPAKPDPATPPPSAAVPVTPDPATPPPSAAVPVTPDPTTPPSAAVPAKPDPETTPSTATVPAAPPGPTASPPPIAPATPPPIAPATPPATPSVAPVAPPDIATSGKPDKHQQRIGPRHRASAPKDARNASPRTRPGELAVPDKAIEVIRDIRQVDPPNPGEHTLDGSPMERDVEFGKPRPKPPSPGAPTSAPPPSHPPKDSTQP